MPNVVLIRPTRLTGLKDQLFTDLRNVLWQSSDPDAGSWHPVTQQDPDVEGQNTEGESGQHGDKKANHLPPREEHTMRRDPVATGRRLRVTRP